MWWKKTNGITAESVLNNASSDELKTRIITLDKRDRRQRAEISFQRAIIQKHDKQ